MQVNATGRRVSEASTQLSLNSIYKELGGKPIVADAHLDMQPGECVVLLGPSGCGKSTTLRMVAGFIEPDNGEIHIEGKLVSGGGVSVPTEKRKLGMVFQSYAVWPHKSVFENVAFGLRIGGEDKVAIQKKVRAVLDIVHLGVHADRYPNELSGGQQQRVALARAIVSEPRLLLLDEPLSNLDASLREEMRIELHRLHKEKGMTMLYVTHDQEEALVLADRIAVMNGGKIVQFDTPEVVYNHPATAFVASFVGAPNLLRGKIVEADTETSRLLIDAGLGAPVWADANASFVLSSQKGDEATIVMRPEDIRLSESGNGFDAQVLDVTFLGHCYETVVGVRGAKVRTRSRTRPIAHDDRVIMNIQANAAWAVPCQ